MKEDLCFSGLLAPSFSFQRPSTDPEMASQHEMNDRGDHTWSGTRPGPRLPSRYLQQLSTDPSTPQEEHKQLGYRVKMEESLKAPTGMFMRTFHSEHIEAQQSPFSLSFLPAVCPSPLQALSHEVQTGFVPLSSQLLCSPQEPNSMSSVCPSLNSRFARSPYLLVPISSPAKFWYRPDVLNCPDWCLCPPMVPVHQSCSPDLILRRTTQQYSRQLILTPTSGHQQTITTPVEVRLQENISNKRIKKSSVSPGPLLDEDLVAEKAFEEYMTIMDSLCPEIQENVEAKEPEESGEPEIKDESFLEFLDELCSDKDFVRNVGSVLNINFLDSLNLFALEEGEMLEANLREQSQPLPTAEETSAATSHIKATNRKGQTLPSLVHPVNSCRLVHHYGCFFVDNSSASSTPDNSHTSDWDDSNLSAAVAPASFPGGDTSVFLPSARLSQNRALVLDLERPSSFRASESLEEMTHRTKDDLNSTIPAPPSQLESCHEPVGGALSELTPEKQSGQQVHQEAVSSELRTAVQGERVQGRGKNLKKCAALRSRLLQSTKVQSPRSTRATQQQSKHTETSDLRSECQSVSPKKRHRHRRGASEERLNERSMDEAGTEGDILRLSPTKKHKMEKKRGAVMKRRGEVETPGCTPRSSSTRSTTQAKS